MAEVAECNDPNRSETELGPHHDFGTAAGSMVKKAIVNDAAGTKTHEVSQKDATSIHSRTTEACSASVSEVVASSSCGDGSGSGDGSGDHHDDNDSDDEISLSSSSDNRTITLKIDELFRKPQRQVDNLSSAVRVLCQDYLWLLDEEGEFVMDEGEISCLDGFQDIASSLSQEHTDVRQQLKSIVVHLRTQLQQEECKQRELHEKMDRLRLQQQWQITQQQQQQKQQEEKEPSSSSPHPQEEREPSTAPVSMVMFVPLDDDASSHSHDDDDSSNHERVSI